MRSSYGLPPKVAGPITTLIESGVNLKMANGINVGLKGGGVG